MSQLPALSAADYAADRGSSIVPLVWVQAAVASVLVALRFYARIKIRSLGLDDWTMLCSVVSHTMHFPGRILIDAQGAFCSIFLPSHLPSIYRRVSTSRCSLASSTDPGNQDELDYPAIRYTRLRCQ